MRLALPFWFWFIYLDVNFWFLTLPVAVALMVAGWYGAQWLGAVRWIAFALAATLVIPFPLIGAFMTFGELRSAAAVAALSRTLGQEETIAGMLLPAGSRILFGDRAHLNIASIELPRPAIIRGIGLSGTLIWNEISQTWSGMLTGDQILDGWPCLAGPAEFDREGVIQTCDLAKAHRLLGYALPPGTHVCRGDGGKPWSFRLPPDGELHVPVLGTTVPGGVTLYVTRDGRLERINSGHGQTIIVHGVALNSMNFYLRDGKAVAPLAETFVLGGELLPKETAVEIDLANGKIAPAPKNWWLTEP